MDDAMLKETHEVKEYIKNLGIEYRFSCYGEKNHEGCQLLGDYFTQIKKEYEKANKVFKMNCDENNYGRSCSSLGKHLLYGKGYKPDISEAVKYFSKACELNDGAGCDFAGKLLAGIDPIIAKHTKLDRKKGLEYLEKGCNLDNPSQIYESSESCYAAGFLLGAGPKEIGQDLEKASKYATKSCDMNYVNGCNLAAELFRLMGKEELAKKYELRFENFRKELTTNSELEMQRT